MNLEILANLTEEEQDQIKESLSYKHINPVEVRYTLPYYKYELTDIIAQTIFPDFAINEQKNFSQNLYSSVNKDPLKRVNYGIRSTGKLPLKFLISLSNWERVYFYRGRWTIREPNLEEPIKLIAARHILKGLEKLYEDHFVRKSEGKYSSQLELPNDKEIKEQCRMIIDSEYEDDNNSIKYAEKCIIAEKGLS